MRLTVRPEPLFAQVTDVFFDILTRKDFDSAELFSSAFKVLWGGWLLLPMDTFGASGDFRLMRSAFAWQPYLAPEAIWGLLLVGLGLNHIHALATRRFRMRRRAVRIGAGIWSAVAVLVFAASPGGPGLVVYGMLALANAWAYWRLGRRLAGW